METYAKALSFAIPGFILLIAIEWVISYLRGMNVNNGMDTISSLSSGMTNTLKEIMGLSIVIISYSWMVNQLALFSIESSALLYLLAFLLLDFAYYWSHRFNHTINVFWNRHIIHHSSEEFNLSCALRQSISSIVVIYFFLYIPMAVVGVPTQVVAIAAPIHLFAQFWYHTRLIDKMGILERIIVTPSHHRVHHAINPEYIDKNFSAIFIIWDKLFGTFQEELKQIPPVYGVKKQVKTWNPIIINYQHMYLLILDCLRTKYWWDKIRLWFMPTGWRPLDVKIKYPVDIVEDVYKMQKFVSSKSKTLLYWSWIQLVIHNLIMYLMLVHIADFPFQQILFLSLYLLLSICSFTSLMDKNNISIPLEILKFIAGFALLLFLNDWFNQSNHYYIFLMFWITYLLISICMTIYIQLYEDESRQIQSII